MRPAGRVLPTAGLRKLPGKGGKVLLNLICKIALVIHNKIESVSYQQPLYL